MRDRCSCHHVRGARPDRARHRHHLAAEARLGKGDRGMRHRLFVMGAICRQLVSHLIERLAKSCNVAVTEDRPNTGDKRHLLPVDLGHLPREITGQCLRHGQSDRAHNGVSLKVFCDSAGSAGFLRRADPVAAIVDQACQSLPRMSQGPSSGLSAI